MQIFGFARAVLYYEFIDNFDLGAMIRLKQIQKLLFKWNTPFLQDIAFYCLYIISTNRTERPKTNTERGPTLFTRNRFQSERPKPTPNANQG